MLMMQIDINPRQNMKNLDVRLYAHTNYDEQLEQARRNFSLRFTEYDKRSGSKKLKLFRTRGVLQ